MVVSAYTRGGTAGIRNSINDFGSILRAIEGIVLGVSHEKALGFADARAADDLRSFFTLATPRVFKTIVAAQDANYFLSNHAPARPPDTE